MDLSLRLLADASSAQGAFKDFGSAATAAAAILKDFAVDSVKAFAESERVMKQLTRAAGENATAFDAMAARMSAQLSIEDEHIKQLQTLALDYGVLPQSVEGATRAVLDWSAATGKDAKSSMLELIKAIDSGSDALDRGRIQFESTGDEAQDMANAIEALNKKFGGAAAADATTLAGSARSAEIALGELKETFGSLINFFESKMNVLGRTASTLRGINAAAQLAADGDFGAAVVALAATGFASTGKIDIGAGAGPEVRAGFRGGADVSVGDITIEGYETKKKGGRGGSGKSDDFGWGPWGDPASDFDHWLEDYQTAGQAKLDALNEQALKEAAFVTKQHMVIFEDEERHDEMMLEAKRKASKQQLDAMAAFTDAQSAELEKRTRMWQRAGSEIGMAVINGIFDAILQATSGDRKDDTKVGIKITQGLFNAIFSAFGMGGISSAMFGSINSMDSGNFEGGAASMFGGMASYGAQAGFANSRHTGGVIERFHSGGPVLGRREKLAVLEEGETVWSRVDVARHGGRANVEAMRTGGGGSRVTVIQAFDATSLLGFMGGAGGRAMVNGQRANLGNLRQAFGKVG